MIKKESSNVLIRRLEKTESIPYELLLLADPSRQLIDIYLVRSEIYVALLGGKMVGTYVLYPINAEEVEIKNISVIDELQGKGVGTLMLRHALGNTKERGYRRMVIGTGNTSIGQLYLYQKEGFEITEIKKNFSIDNYPEILFENGIHVKHMIVLEKSI